MNVICQSKVDEVIQACIVKAVSVEGEYYVDMFYDKYEADFGDGFYPVLHNDFAQIDNSLSLKPIRILFVAMDSIKSWRACGRFIHGLDESTGPDLLKLLNDTRGKKMTSILNVYNGKIHPK